MGNPGFNNRADAWARLGEYNKALEDRSAAIRLDPQGTSGYCGRGGIHKQLGNDKQMRTDLQKCIRLTSEEIAADPRDINAYNRHPDWRLTLKTNHPDGF